MNINDNTRCKIHQDTKIVQYIAQALVTILNMFDCLPRLEEWQLPGYPQGWRGWSSCCQRRCSLATWRVINQNWWKIIQTLLQNHGENHIKSHGFTASDIFTANWGRSTRPRLHSGHGSHRWGRHRWDTNTTGVVVAGDGEELALACFFGVRSGFLGLKATNS